jgi:sortase (surface protein transpeptidase)
MRIAKRISCIQTYTGGRSGMMKGETRMTGVARVIGLLVALALLLSLLLPLVGASAQETDPEEDGATTEALAEVPTTGARRPGPVILAASRVATPEAESEPEPVAGVAPIALQVPSVGVDAPIELGAVVDGVMMDPSGAWVVSWYEPLGKVGEGGNVVMAGHVDYWNVGPAVFWDVRYLPAGEVIRVVGEDGKNYDYAVEWTQSYLADQLTPEVIQGEIVGDTGEETLTLITCGGEFDPATGEYNERWVVRANRV